MDFKYYKDIPTTTYVWFKLLDKAGKLLEDFPDHPCYGSIAHGFDKKTRQIHVYHDKDKVPYDVACVKRWIADLNEMGFPCTFVEEEDTIAGKQEKFIGTTVNEGLEDMALSLLRHGNEPTPATFNFFVDLDDYNDKNYLFSTLSLIRCLTEGGICRVPEEYFKLMDESPNMDKFEACQAAHKLVSKRDKPYDPKNYANTGHMVTFDGNGDNISRAELTKRFKEHKTNLRDKGYLKINANWNGSDQKRWKEKGGHE
jgi:hypothetical protein